jgi:hypothetical protein
MRTASSGSNGHEKVSTSCSIWDRIYEDRSSGGINHRMISTHSVWLTPRPCRVLLYSPPPPLSTLMEIRYTFQAKLWVGGCIVAVNYTHTNIFLLKDS